MGPCSGKYKIVAEVALFVLYLLLDYGERGLCVLGKKFLERLSLTHDSRNPSRDLFMSAPVELELIRTNVRKDEHLNPKSIFTDRS